MKLSLKYLNKRHSYWKKRISDAGIWDENKFQRVFILIRPDCRTYNALFQRRLKTVNGVKQYIDKIIIYNKVNEFDPSFLDSILVHEMIHQYIHQAGLKDNRTHGTMFRTIMRKINENFPNDLKINITDSNPGVPTEGPGKKTHRLLLMHLNDGHSFLCVVNPAKVSFFESMIRKNKTKWKVKHYAWARSNDVFFNNYSRCTRVLHGIKKHYDEIMEICGKYNVTLEI